MKNPVKVRRNIRIRLKDEKKHLQKYAEMKK